MKVLMYRVGAVGLITYMRTDSCGFPREALRAAAEYILKDVGERSISRLPTAFPIRATAQDGHEAIRPSTISLTPESVRQSLTPDQYKLYKLIWERFIACQMANSVETQCRPILKVTGICLRLPVMRLRLTAIRFSMRLKMREGKEKKPAALPPLEEGMSLRLKGLGATSILHSRRQDIQRPA